MDEIITVNKLTWDNRSNDVFGLCANHPSISYQLDNLSIRKLKKALDKGLIHPATESLVVAITLVESWNLGDGDDCDDYIEKDSAVVEDYDCVVDSAFDDPTLGDFISDIIFEGGVDCYMEFDGDKYHKSNLVNNMLNSSTNLLSSDRNV
jgi:hypothetical protein